MFINNNLADTHTISSILSLIDWCNHDDSGCHLIDYAGN